MGKNKGPRITTERICPVGSRSRTKRTPDMQQTLSQRQVFPRNCRLRRCSGQVSEQPLEDPLLPHAEGL